MDWNTYMNLFDAILDGEITEPPYDKEAYVHYVKLNQARIKRWLKKNPIDETIIARMKRIETPQKWYLITEPWCGDAAHSTPIIQLLAALNSNIELEILQRDKNDMIEDYLTNGSRSIPKLVARDLKGEDIFTWGPRPSEAQKFVLELKASEKKSDEVNKSTQAWYNKDSGQTTLNEIVEMILG